MVDRVLGIDRLQAIYDKVSKQNRPFAECLLDELGVTYRVDPGEMERLPRTGAAIVVANHPFGMLDGAILTSLLMKVRDDFKVLTNAMLSSFADLNPHCIFVDPFEHPGAIDINLPALRQALVWLKQGGMLAIFPAGEVSHLDLRQRGIVDPPWNSMAARLARSSRVPVLPVYFRGANSMQFQLLGTIHPTLRTVALPSELFNKRGLEVGVRVGRPVTAARLKCLPSDADAVRYLRWRTYLLGTSAEKGFHRFFMIRRKGASLANAVPPGVLAREIASLPPSAELARVGEHQVFCADAPTIPAVLEEIGRLREITFRAVGEGTGRASDIDTFDAYYQHLFLWNSATREIAGAYRLVLTTDVLERQGLKGLYTTTLFDYDERLLERTGPALELGRSFVRPEYQRQYTPLHLLWKGIARLVLRRPEAPVLFGAVSISNDYTPAARRLVASYLESRYAHSELCQLVRPRRPLRRVAIREWDFEAIARLVSDYEELGDPVADLEADGKGIPVLLRQYLRVGGKLLGFNVDPRFGNALDGLILVDLRQTDPGVLARVIGKKEAAALQSAWMTSAALPL